MSGAEESQPKDRVPNVFLSYARSDEPAAAKLVVALEQAGFEVWWDARIEGGAMFAKSIDAALDRCDAVVVLWSAAAVQSDWVLDEASRGRQQRKLVPVSIDGTPPPLGFGQYQAIKLTGWNGDPKAPEVGALLRGVASVAGHALHALPEAPAARWLPHGASSRRTRLLAAGSVAVGAAILVFALRPAEREPPAPPPSAAPAEEAPGPLAVPDGSVGVLRFVNLDGSEQTQVFSDGLADDLITALSGVPGLFVSSRGDSFTLEPNVGSARVRERLRVAHYVEGSVQIQGEAMRVALPEDTGPLLANELQARDLDAYVAYRRGRDLVAGSSELDALDEAIGHYRQALSIDPQYAAAQAGLCDAYCARFHTSNAATDVQTAEQACAAALATSPRLYLVHTSLGTLYQLTGRTDEAERAYRIALESNPKDVRAMIGLARVLASRHDHPAAEQLFGQAIAMQPGNMVTLDSYAGYLFSLGRYDDAANTYAQALALDPDEPSLRGNLGSALMLAGRLEDAKQAYEEALGRKEYDTAYYNLAVVYYFLWDFDKSVATFRKAIGISPNIPVYWISMADSLFFAGQPAEATKAFRRGAELAEERLAVAAKDADTMFVLAWALQNLGRKGDAQEMYQKGLSLSPQAPYGFYFGALIDAMNGDRDAALEALRGAVESGYPPALLAADPYFDDFRTDPGFDAALAAAP